MKAALRWIASSLPLMVLALILSSLAWFVALEEEDPTQTDRYGRPVPIILTGLSTEMLLISSSDETIQVDLRATESVWRNLSPNDFTATADLTGLGPGIHEISIHMELERTPSRVLSVEPQSITVALERYAERTVPVRVQIDGEQALGYFRRTEAVAPLEVTVSGPESYVSQVVEAFTRISIKGASADVEGVFPLQLLDAEGQPVSQVEFTPEAVNLRVPIELSGYYRPLPVRAVLEGQVAADHRITGISVHPTTIMVFGPPNTISAIPGYLETQPVDVEGAVADIVERPQLNLPENVSVVTGQQPVEVRVSIDAVQSSRTVAITPTLQGLRIGLTATVPLEAVEVILSGSLPVLESLEADDVRVTLDLFGLSSGKHQIEPQVIVPEGITAQNILPATIQVEISPVVRPTPTLTTTITPALPSTPTPGAGE